MKFFLFLMCFIFFLGCFGVFLNRKHLLTIMLCLELLLVSLFVNFSLLCSFYSNYSFCSSSLVLLTFSACEASLGLALLITVSRSYSNNNIFSLNLL
uniref:NADH-ubiquinone oxidoreductase chain 4L n=1 Tax=Comaster schlegelii TaxID=1529421 RepID=A0A8K2AUC3_9ECHI|nr:NADH dehydrogenase subunit 4L [Comaster schlegelii]UGV21713.1 NADH dehydrogenase subunit 4l [Comaster schlegelii]